MARARADTLFHTVNPLQQGAPALSKTDLYGFDVA